MFGHAHGPGRGGGRARLFRILGAETRQRIIDLLTSGPLPVSEIARRLGVSQPAASQHLAALREAGLVTDRREGQQVRYSLVGPAHYRYRLGARAFGCPPGKAGGDLEAYRRFLRAELERTERRIRRGRPSEET